MRKSLFYTFLFWILSFLVGVECVCGQVKMVHIPDMYQGRILSWNSVKGLSQSSTSAVVEDPLGFIWVGTQDGLNRFDGSKFTVYKHEFNNEKSLSGNTINCLLVDPFGGILVGTDNGVSRYDLRKKSFSRLLYSRQPMSKINVTTLAVDSSGLLWVGTSRSFFYSFNPISNKIFKYHVPARSNWSEPFITSIYCNRDRSIWLSTKNGIYLFKKHHYYLVNNTANLIDSAYANMIVGVAKYDENNFLIATFGDGIYQFDVKTLKFSRFIDLKKYVNIEFGNGIVNCLLVDDAKNVWMGTDNGLLVKKKGVDEPILYHPDGKQGLESKNIRSLSQDKAGNIWIGTWNGLSLFLKQNIPFYTVPVFENSTTKFLSNSILAVLVDSKNRLWVGTDNQGVACCDLTTGKSSHYNTSNSKIGSNNIMTLTEDMRGNIWIGTWGVGFSIFNPEKNQFQSLLNTTQNPHIISDNIIHGVAKSNNGFFYVATEKGVDVINSFTLKVMTNYTALKLIKHKCNVATVDISGVLWIGSDVGVDKYIPKTDELTGIKTSVPITKVRSILYHNKSLWIGTLGDGLFDVDPKSGNSIRYDERAGLPNNVVYSIMADNNDRIWMSTNSGVSCLSLASRTFKNYFDVDGLQGNEFNSGASFTDNNGFMFFGGISGLSFFNPNEIFKLSPKKPEVFIANILFDGKDAYPNTEISFAQSINLSYATKQLVIDFSVMQNNKSIPYIYSWKLNGFSDEWSVPSKSGSVTFTNLTPGDYLLDVMVDNPNGGGEKNYYKLKISIDAPFWMKWSFWIVVITGFGASVFVFQKRRIYRIERKNKALEEKIAQRTEKLKIATEIAETKSLELESENKMKTRFFSIIAHDIKNPLWGINQMSDAFLKNDSNSNPNEVQDKMMQINNASKHLGSLLENLLTWSSAQSGRISYRPQPVNIYTLVDDVVDFYEGFLIAKNVNIKNRIDAGLFVMADKQSLQVAIQNLISNAIKFSFPSSEVSVDAKEYEFTVEISIADSGVGMDAEKLRNLFDITTLRKTSGTQNEQGTGLGLLLCKEFIAKNGGTISVSSVINRGTTFFISLPKTNVDGSNFKM